MSNDAIKALNDFAATLDKAPDVIEKVLRRSQRPILDLLLGEISSSTDPYGNPWAPMKRGEGAPLASLEDSVSVNLVSGKKLVAKAEYPLNFHNSGTRQLSQKAALKQIRAKAKGRLSKQTFKDSRADFKEAAKLASEGGGQHDPKRPVVPNTTQGTPPAWTQVLEQNAAAVMAETFGK